MVPTTRPNVAPALNTYGPHASRVVRLIRHRPALAGGLFYAPVRAVHAVGAYLHLAAPADDQEVARQLDEVAPRDLWQQTIPEADPRLYRALYRCGSTVMSMDFYERIRDLAASPMVEVLLAANGTIDVPFLRHLETLTKSDAAVTRLPARLLADQTATEAFLAIAAALRSYGLDVSGTFAGLPKRAGWESVVRRIMSVLNTLEAPPLPQPLPPDMQQIRTVAELREAGRSLDLCIRHAAHGGAGHWMRLLDGRSIYIVVPAQPMIAELRRVAPGLWKIEEARRPSNRPIPPWTVRMLTASLLEAGWRLTDTDPATAMVTLTARLDADFEAWDRSLGATLRELGDAWA